MEAATPLRPQAFLNNLDKSGALISPQATNFIVNQMLEFGRHYAELRQANALSLNESIKDWEQRVFGVTLEIE